MFADSFVFRQKVYCPFLRMEWVLGWGHKTGYFCGCHKCMTLNGLKLQPIQLLEAVVSSSTSSQTHFDCIKNNTQPPSPTHPSPRTMA